MLCDVKIAAQSGGVYDVLSILSGGNMNATPLDTGVYEIAHFNFDHMLSGYKLEKYPDLVDHDGNYFDCYGVCDNYHQILNSCTMLKTSDKHFVISLTKVSKEEQPSEGGWRWHKWGEYIGVHEPQMEYLYDEPEIDEVYVYHIYEIL